MEQAQTTTMSEKTLCATAASYCCFRLSVCAQPVVLMTDKDTGRSKIQTTVSKSQCWDCPVNVTSVPEYAGFCDFIFLSCMCSGDSITLGFCTCIIYAGEKHVWSFFLPPPLWFHNGPQWLRRAPLPDRALYGITSQLICFERQFEQVIFLKAAHGLFKACTFNSSYNTFLRS